MARGWGYFRDSVQKFSVKKHKMFNIVGDSYAFWSEGEGVSSPGHHINSVLSVTDKKMKLFFIVPFIPGT